MAARAALLLAFFCGALHAELPPPGAALRVASLAVLVDHLAGADPVERLRFAAIALDEHARAYEAELRAEAQDARPRSDPQSIRRWRAAAAASIAELREVGAALALSADVTIFVDPGATLRFILARRTVIVDAPRIADARELNERIVARYCRAAHCPDLIAPGRPGRDPSPEPVRATWSFAAGRPAVVETSTGLDFHFSDPSALATRRAEVTRLAGALQAAARELAWYRDRGAPIEWSVLHLTRRAEDGAAVLVVNRAGDYLVLDLPPLTLPREPLANWFRARLAGRTYHHVFASAEQVFGADTERPEAAQ